MSREQVRQAWKNRADRFLHDPRTEICLIVLIFLSVVLLVAEEATPPRNNQSNVFYHLPLSRNQ